MTLSNSNHITLPHVTWHRTTSCHHITARGVTTAERVRADRQQKLGLRHDVRSHDSRSHDITLLIRSHDSIWLHVAWHSRTKTKTKKLHHEMTWHEITWQHLTSQVANNHSNSPQITSQLAASLQSTSKHKHITSKHMTSQPRNGKSFVHTRKMFWASQ